MFEGILEVVFVANGCFSLCFLPTPADPLARVSFQSILQRYLGEYVDGIDRKNLQVGDSDKLVLCCSQIVFKLALCVCCTNPPCTQLYHQLGVWSGEVKMKNLSLKKSALDFLQLPLEIVSGRVQELEMNVPWRSLSSAPVTIKLKGVCCVCCAVLCCAVMCCACACHVRTCRVLLVLRRIILNYSASVACFCWGYSTRCTYVLS